MDIAAVAFEKITIPMDATLSRWSSFSTDAAQPRWVRSRSGAPGDHDLKSLALMKVGLP
jgi:hypothetical protein